MDPPPPSIRIRIRRGPEWLLLVSVLLAGAVGVAVLNRWPSISGLQVLELLAAAAV